MAGEQTEQRRNLAQQFWHWVTTPVRYVFGRESRTETPRAPEVPTTVQPIAQELIETGAITTAPLENIASSIPNVNFTPEAEEPVAALSTRPTIIPFDESMERPNDLVADRLAREEQQRLALLEAQRQALIVADSASSVTQLQPNTATTTRPPEAGVDQLAGPPSLGGEPLDLTHPRNPQTITPTYDPALFAPITTEAPTTTPLPTTTPVATVAPTTTPPHAAPDLGPVDTRIADFVFVPEGPIGRDGNRIVGDGASIRQLQTMLNRIEGDIRQTTGKLYDVRIDNIYGARAGDAVFALETMLVNKGYLEILGHNPDRLYTPETAAALTAFLTEYPDALREDGTVNLNYQPPGPSFGDKGAAAASLRDVTGGGSFTPSQRFGGRFADTANAQFISVFGGDVSSEYMRDVAYIVSGHPELASPGNVERYYQETAEARRSSTMRSQLQITDYWHHRRYIRPGESVLHEGIDADVIGSSAGQDTGIYATAPIVIMFAGINTDYGWRIEYATQVRDPETGQISTVIRSTSHLSYIHPEILRAFSQGSSDPEHPQMLIVPPGFRIGTMGGSGTVTRPGQSGLLTVDYTAHEEHAHEEMSVIPRPMTEITSRNITGLVDSYMVDPARELIQVSGSRSDGRHIPPTDVAILADNSAYVSLVNPSAEVRQYAESQALKVEEVSRETVLAASSSQSLPSGTATTPQSGIMRASFTPGQ